MLNKYFFQKLKNQKYNKKVFFLKMMYAKNKSPFKFQGENPILKEILNDFLLNYNSIEAVKK